MGESGKLNIPGEELKGVYGALKFIENVKKENWSKVNVGKRVAVIGAGNTSIDAATEAKRLGAEEVMIVTGGTDILLKINVESIEALNDFIIKKLRNIDGVDKTNTMVILNEF